MATHSGTLAWRIPQTEEPNGIQSMGSQRGEETETQKHKREDQSPVGLKNQGSNHTPKPQMLNNGNPTT